jgi:hypothetical protein
MNAYDDWHKYIMEGVILIVGISHITFIVKDLERTSNFLKGIFNAIKVYSNSTVKYFQINDFWIAYRNVGRKANQLFKVQKHKESPCKHSVKVL